MKIKNLRIFGIKKSRKYTMVKVTAAALATLTLLTSLTGCVSNYNKYDDYNNSYYIGIYDDYNKEDKPQVPGINDNEQDDGKNSNENNKPIIDNGNTNYNPPIIQYDEESKKIITSDFKIDNNLLSSYIYQINGIKVNYPLNEFYKVEEALNKYYSIYRYKGSTNLNIIKNNSLSVDDLYNIVQKNNEKENFSSDKKMNSTDLKKVCTIICDVINEYLKNNNIDKLLLEEKISNLKIKKYTEMSNGYYDPATGIMGFDINKISKSSDFYKKTVEHETFHFLQASSLSENDSQNYEMRMGPCYKFEGLDVNSLYWDWFYEGTAEYLTMNKNNTKDTETYKSVIDSLNIIKIATILNNESLENLSLSNDLEDIFNYFGCKTNQDKKEIVNLMYGYNIIHSLNSFSTSKDFYDFYKETVGESLSGEEKLIFERILKNSVSQTLTKQFYINLAQTIQNKSVKVEDVFALISLFEYSINKQSRYSVAEYYYNDYEEFFEIYTQIQSEFFELIANNLGIGIDEIYNAYNAYNKYGSINIQNNQLLNNDQKEFYNYILSTKTTINSINIEYDKCLGKSQTR